jgi:hypothetical protein
LYDVGNSVVDTGVKPLSAEREHSVMKGGCIFFRRSNEEDVGRKVGDVDDGAVRQQVITRESDDDRFARKCLAYDT